ncbi:MAG: alpha/beta hydrolase [Proteobacteria bacterium]|nr:alpha/beta hydrolase [Pseudomonadota bacterium]
MPSIDIHGVRAHYADIGRGVPVLMVHAATNHGGQWDQVRAAMDRTANGPYRYLLPDLFDSGRTGPWPSGPSHRELTFNEEADIVLGVLAVVGAAVHLVGHSYGGAVALRAALRAALRGGAGIRSLCLIEPGGCPLLAAAGLQSEYDEYVAVMDAFLTALDRADPPAAWRGFLNYYRGHPDAWDSLDQDTQAKIIGKSQTQRQVYRAQMSNPTSLVELRALKVETMIITGDASTAPERGVCRVLKEYLPNAMLHIIPGAGHPMPTSHPTEVAAALSGHINAIRNLPL